ncbi:hypothetical protein HMN09_01163400 [Mycena chlorophos]|uniref:Uncharacterized protein n=1 Tax=Mycena chlorophos TaxID=658473 RepID=A0A8H6S9N4_MYCCL|nr:hypothetical protein HMN09_01163400 [Mycena chlorophos]
MSGYYNNNTAAGAPADDADSIAGATAGHQENIGALPVPVEAPTSELMPTRMPGPPPGPAINLAWVRDESHRYQPQQNNVTSTTWPTMNPSPLTPMANANGMNHMYDLPAADATPKAQWTTTAAVEPGALPNNPQSLPTGMPPPPRPNSDRGPGLPLSHSGWQSAPNPILAWISSHQKPPTPKMPRRPHLAAARAKITADEELLNQLVAKRPPGAAAGGNDNAAVAQKSSDALDWEWEVEAQHRVIMAGKAREAWLVALMEPKPQPPQPPRPVIPLFQALAALSQSQSSTGTAIQLPRGTLPTMASPQAPKTAFGVQPGPSPRVQPPPTADVPTAAPVLPSIPGTQRVPPRSTNRRDPDGASTVREAGLSPDPRLRHWQAFQDYREPTIIQRSANVNGDSNSQPQQMPAASSHPLPNLLPLKAELRSQELSPAGAAAVLANAKKWTLENLNATRARLIAGERRLRELQAGANPPNSAVAPPSSGPGSGAPSTDNSEIDALRKMLALSAHNERVLLLVLKQLDPNEIPMPELTYTKLGNAVGLRA